MTKRNPCFKLMGGRPVPKVRRSRAAAIVAAIELTLEKERPYRPYRCPNCGFWHAGREMQPSPWVTDFDIAAEIEVGKRAMHCAKYENVGPWNARLAVLQKRCRRVLLRRDANPDHRRPTAGKAVLISPNFGRKKAA